MVTNVLVTGGCGRIGKRLVQRLVDSGDNVMVIDLQHGDIKGVKYITAPLAEIKDLKGVEVIYHLAAVIDYKASLAELMRKNAAPTARLLQMCKGCRQFILMSTTSVYGDSKEPITEETPVKPYTKYGQSKLACEKLVVESGVPYTILRSSQVYGPDFEEGYAKVLKKIQRGQMRIFGKGSNFIPLVHINDLVEALLLVKDNKKALNNVFNADGDYGKTQEEFMDIAAEILGAKPPEVHVNPTAAKIIGRLTGKSVSVAEYIDKLTNNRKISIEKIARIGFKPKVTLHAGMKEVIEAFRKRGLLDK
jgi:UDP-glucose 4-epimerase